jgi:sorting nexin-1/2
VEQLSGQLSALHSAIKALVAHRKELASLTGGVAKSAAMLSTCEEHVGLSKALSQLADVEEKIEILRSEQSNSDLYILSETVKDYVGLFGAIKDVFHERVKVFQNWQHAQMQLTKKRENKAKLELNGRNDKLEYAQKEVEEVCVFLNIYYYHKKKLYDVDESNFSGKQKCSVVRKNLMISQLKSKRKWNDLKSIE